MDECSKKNVVCIIKTEESRKKQRTDLGRFDFFFERKKDTSLEGFYGNLYPLEFGFRTYFEDAGFKVPKEAFWFTVHGLDNRHRYAFLKTDRVKCHWDLSM